MTREHPHPDFHAEALALVGGNLPLAVRVSHALAEARDAERRRCAEVVNQTGKDIANESPGSDALLAQQAALFVAYCDILELSFSGWDGTHGVVRGHENAGEHVAQPLGNVRGGRREAES